MIKFTINALSAMAGAFLLFSSTYGQNMAFDWAKVIGGGFTEYGISITTDKWGNVYTAGAFSFGWNTSTQGDTVDFNPPNGYLIHSQGAKDAYLVKHDLKGNFLWARAFGSPKEDQCNSIKTDSDGNVYMVGQFQETPTFTKGSSPSVPLTSTGSDDVFIIKYDSSGALIWAKQVGGAGKDIAYALDIHSGTNNIFITGEFTGTSDFDPSNNSFTMTSNNKSADVFVLKLNSDGNFIWAKAMGSPSADYSYGISVDKSENVYITGNFSGTAIFDANSTNHNVTSKGGSDIFIAKLNSLGNIAWVHGMGDTRSDLGFGVKVSDSGYVYVTGEFVGNVNFTPNATKDSVVLTSAGLTPFFPPSDIFVAKWTLDGELVWAKRMGGTAIDRGNAIDVDLRDNVYISGWFSSMDASFNPDSITGSKKTMGANDLFITKLDTKGNYLWAETMGSAQNDYGYDITVDASGNVHTTGYVRGGVLLNPWDDTAIIFTYNATQDFYVHRLICVDTSSVSLTVDLCEDSYSYNDVEYTQSGTYVQKYVNALGCDSLTYLNITLRGVIAEPIITVNENILRTDGDYATYQWLREGALISGATSATYNVTENGAYQVVVSNEGGCIDTSDRYLVNNASLTNQSLVSFQVFPNPANSHITIQSNIHFNSADLRIINFIGQTIAVYHNLQGNVLMLDIDHLTSGIYSVEIIDNGEHTVRQKFIKN